MLIPQGLELQTIVNDPTDARVGTQVFLAVESISSPPEVLVFVKTDLMYPGCCELRQ